MNNTNFPQILLVFIAMFSQEFAFGQATKEAVILYNSLPVKAEITTDGNVNRIISEEPDFLKGFTLKVQDYGQFVAQTEAPKKNDPVASSQSYSINAGELASVKFDPDYATLSDETISTLDQIIALLKDDNQAKISLETISKLNTALVSKNRFNSIRTYLKIRGIDPERISFQSLVGDTDVNQVKIYLIK
ncbi:MAG: hypothetical protein IPJ39_03885 [Saprospiraceae bacterium]|nr:hypothetical protein [Saprospiraceae bacterium]MBK7697909.1 hypothetical protein [Saprospiraceae bacterium]